MQTSAVFALSSIGLFVSSQIVSKYRQIVPIKWHLMVKLMKPILRQTTEALRCILMLRSAI